MKKKQKKHKKIRPNFRKNLWRVIDFVVTIAPLLTIAIYNREVYFGERTAYANTAGLSLLGIFLCLAISGKIKVLKGMGGITFILIILVLIKSILNDLVLIAFGTWVGMFISNMFTNPRYIRWCKIADKTETANINATATKEVVQEIMQEIRQTNQDWRV